MTKAADALERIRLQDGIAATLSPGTGEAVLWFHGYTMNASIWTELWEHLPGWSHVGIDLPGHGASRPIKPGEDLPALGRTIGAIALDLGVRHLVALSFGTILALQTAIEHPRSFASLVLGAPALGGGPQDPLVGRRYVELWHAHSLLGPGPELTALWMKSPPDVFKGAEARPDLWRRLSAAIGQHGWTELADGSMRPLAAHRQEPAELARVAAATLVLVGEHDLEMSNTAADLLARALPTCERVDLPGLGHLCLIEAPERAAALVARHLGANATERATAQ